MKALKYLFFVHFCSCLHAGDLIEQMERRSEAARLGNQMLMQQQQQRLQTEKIISAIQRNGAPVTASESYDFQSGTAESLRRNLEIAVARDALKKPLSDENFEAVLAACQEQAITLYPDLRDPNSKISIEVESIYSKLEKADSPLLYEAITPLVIAHIAAAELGIKAADQ